MTADYLGASQPGPARVWAPNAAHVDLVRVREGVTETFRLTAAAAGWFSGADLQVDDRYGFLLDGNGPFPDPRSPAQPDGVHALSEMVSLAKSPKASPQWAGREALGAVLYELHIGTFTAAGTFDAAAVELTRLADMGIEVVSIMPVAPFPGTRGWGYDGVGFFAVNETYGGPHGLLRFVEAAHRLGLGVCLDVVYNHQGPDGNYLGMYGPYFTDAHSTPWGWALNVDQVGSEAVRAHVIGSALRWFSDFGVDALRLDAVHEIKDDSGRHLLAELADAVDGLSKTLNRPLRLIAESDLNDENMVTATSAGGMGQHLQWADDIHHAIHSYLTGERHGYYDDFGSLEALNHVFQNVFWHDGKMSTFRGKPWGRPVSPTTDRRAFVAYTSTHDQVGNRALGDRPVASLSPGKTAAGLALVLLSPFTPMLFMGEEYGEDQPFQYFTDHEPELGAAVTAGRLAEFASHGWDDNGAVNIPDPQAESTFVNSKLSNAHSSAPRYEQMREWVKTCIEARKLTLLAPSWETNPAEVTELRPGVLSMSGPVRVLANFTDEPFVFQTRTHGKLIGHFGEVRQDADAVTLAPGSVALLHSR